jgi:hypothetical protein
MFVVDKQDFGITHTAQQQRSPIKVHGSHAELAFWLAHVKNKDSSLAMRMSLTIKESLQVILFH